VERAESLQVAAAGVAQCNVFTDDIGDRRPVADRGDVLVPDATRHERRV
jgi:hypothetical protein